MQSTSTAQINAMQSFNADLLANVHRHAAYQFHQAASNVRGDLVLQNLQHALDNFLLIPVVQRTLDDYKMCVKIKANLILVPLALAKSRIERSQLMQASADSLQQAVTGYKSFNDLLMVFKREQPALLSIFLTYQADFQSEYLRILNGILNKIKLSQDTILLVARNHLQGLNLYTESSLAVVSALITFSFQLAFYMDSLENLKVEQKALCQFLHDIATLLSPCAMGAYATILDKDFAINYHNTVISLVHKIPPSQRTSDDAVLVFKHISALRDLQNLHQAIVPVRPLDSIIITDVSGLYTNGLYTSPANQATPAVTLASLPRPAR